MAGGTDSAQVQRTWGLLETVPTRKEQAYGPNFSFREFMKPRNWLTGIGVHYGLLGAGLVMVTPWLRRLAAGWLQYQPGQGPEIEAAKADEIEYRGVARRDGDAGERVMCRAEFRGSMYYCESLSFFLSCFSVSQFLSVT